MIRALRRRAKRCGKKHPQWSPGTGRDEAILQTIPELVLPSAWQEKNLPGLFRWRENPRLILMPIWHDRMGELEKAADLPAPVKAETEQFFLSVTST
jgi:hypothetical protein